MEIHLLNLLQSGQLAVAIHSKYLCSNVLERHCKVRLCISKNKLLCRAQWALYSVFPMPYLSCHALDSERLWSLHHSWVPGAL